MILTSQSFQVLIVRPLIGTAIRDLKQQSNCDFPSLNSMSTLGEDLYEHQASTNAI
jgi:hypothetical protein